MKSRKQFLNAYGIELNKRKHVELLMFLVCCELILSFSYLGFIQLAPISVTTLHILVIVAAMYFGPVDAMAVALVFGLVSMWKASLTSTEIGDIIFSPTLSGKPVESVVMAVGTRLVFAIAAGLMFRWFFSKERKHRRLGIVIISVLATGIHSALVYACMAGWFGAAETETTASFDNALMVNNIILYTVAILVALGFDKLMQYQPVNNLFVITSRENREFTKRQRNVSILLTVIILLSCVFICMHFVSRFDTFVKDRNILSHEHINWIYALLSQFLVGVAATFGVLALFIRWMQEYFSALTLEANMRARESAESANKSKTFFLFNMSHDIRTPMNAIVGFIDKAKRHKDNPEILDDSLNKATESSRYLLSMINDILDMAKIEADKLELNEEIDCTTDGIASLRDLFADSAEKNGINFHTDFDVKEKYLWIDANRVNRIMANLLSNAIKYTDRGGDVWYSVKEVPSDKEGYVKVTSTVRDNGKGMSPEFVEKIFEPFERAESATKSKIQGTGLGMSIVKRLVDLMDGELEIDSELGKGTTISVTLELKIPTEEEVYNYLRKTDAKAEAEDADFHGKKVLLVEDNELNREIARDILEEAGMLVDEAEDGDVAVEKVQKHVDEGDDEYYDFILMDIQMPRMNGYEATRAIRAIPTKHNTRMPIIAVSANAFEEDKKASLEAGMDGHVAKPIDLQELWGALAKFL